MRKKTVFLMICILACFSVFMAGCTPTYNDKDSDKAKTITVSVKIIAANDKTLFDGNIAVKSNTPTLSMATCQALLTAKITYSEVGGEYDDFAGYPTTQDNGWVCTVNDVKLSASEKQQAIKDGDKIVWEYGKIS